MGVCGSDSPDFHVHIGPSFFLFFFPSLSSVSQPCPHYPFLSNVMVQGLLNILSPRNRFRKGSLSPEPALMTAGRAECAGTRIHSPWLFKVLTQRIVKVELGLRHIIMIHVWACICMSSAFLCRPTLPSCVGVGVLTLDLWGHPPQHRDAALIALKRNLKHVRMSLTKTGLAFIIDIELRPGRLWAAAPPEALLCTRAAQTPTPALGDL